MLGLIEHLMTIPSDSFRLNSILGIKSSDIFNYLQSFRPVTKCFAKLSIEHLIFISSFSCSQYSMSIFSIQKFSQQSLTYNVQYYFNLCFFIKRIYSLFLYVSIDVVLSRILPSTGSSILSCELSCIDKYNCYLLMIYSYKI